VPAKEPIELPVHERARSAWPASSRESSGWQAPGPGESLESRELSPRERFEPLTPDSLRALPSSGQRVDSPLESIPFHRARTESLLQGSQRPALGTRVFGISTLRRREFGHRGSGRKDEPRRSVSVRVLPPGIGVAGPKVCPWHRQWGKSSPPGRESLCLLHPPVVYPDRSE